MKRVANWFASALVADGSGSDDDSTPVDVRGAPYVSVDDLIVLAEMTEKAELSSTAPKNYLTNCSVVRVIHVHWLSKICCRFLTKGRLR